MLGTIASGVYRLLESSAQSGDDDIFSEVGDQLLTIAANDAVATKGNLDRSGSAYGQDPIELEECVGLFISAEGRLSQLLAHLMSWGQTCTTSGIVSRPAGKKSKSPMDRLVIGKSNDTRLVKHPRERGSGSEIRRSHTFRSACRTCLQERWRWAAD